MVNGFAGTSGSGEMQRVILRKIIRPLTLHGILMVKFKQLRTGIKGKKMVSGLGGIRMDILIVLENILIIQKMVSGQYGIPHCRRCLR